jgi:hypothetical protein
MADIIKLRVARKQKRKAEEQQQAEENRARFGRPKADRNAELARKAKRNRDLDAHRLQPEAET